MPKRIFTTALLILALIGQGLAYASSVSMHSNSSDLVQMQPDQAPHADKHCADNTQAQPKPQTSHCQSDCNCAQQCNAQQILLVTAPSYNLNTTGVRLYSPAPLFHSLPLTPLHRPPIAA